MAIVCRHVCTGSVLRGAHGGMPRLTRGAGTDQPLASSWLFVSRFAFYGASVFSALIYGYHAAVHPDRLGVVSHCGFWKRVSSRPASSASCRGGNGGEHSRGRAIESC